MKNFFKYFIVIILTVAITVGVCIFINNRNTQKDNEKNIAKIDFTEEQKLNMIKGIKEFNSTSDLSDEEMMEAISYGVHLEYIDGGTIEESWMVIPEEKIKSAIYSLFGVELKENKSSENEYFYKYENGKYYFGLSDGDPRPVVVNMSKEDVGGTTHYRFNYIGYGNFIEYYGERYEVTMKDGFIQSKKVVNDSIFYEAGKIEANILNEYDQELVKVIEKIINSGEEQFKTEENSGYYIYKDDFGGKYEVNTITGVLITSKMKSNDEKYTLYEATLYYKNKDMKDVDEDNNAYNIDAAIVINNQTDEYEIHAPCDKYITNEKLTHNVTYEEVF